jgi:hypothetical protein
MYRSPENLGELLELGQQLRSLENRNSSLLAEAAEDLLRIRNRRGNEVPLLANTSQRRFEATRGDHNIILKARQMGMTTWIAGRFFLRTITTEGALTVQVAQTREAAESIFRMVQRFYDCLPTKLQKELKRSRNNVGQMTFKALDSEFRILSASDRNAGRGLTIHNLHCSELSRWTGDAGETLAGLRGALVPGGELVLESTPNGACGCFYDEWVEAEERGVEKHFFPWWLEDAYVAAPVTDPTQAEVELMGEPNKLKPEQIGFRRTLERSYRGLKAQEFAEDPETCFKASGECCFEVEAIERSLQQVWPAKMTRHDGALEIWLPVQPGRSYVIGVDPAGGSPDGDYSAVQVIDLETGSQCAELRKHLSLRDLATVSAALAREYNGALLAVERNNHGSGVLAHLEETEDYRNLYENEGKAGWPTTSLTKPTAISHMDTILVNKPEAFRSLRLLRECRSFIARAGAGMGAAGGAHDDLVMAMAIAQAVRHEMLGGGRPGRRGKGDRA